MRAWIPAPLAPSSLDLQYFTCDRDSVKNCQMNYKIISNFPPREHDRLASFFSKCGLWTSNMASPGILLEMQSIMSHPRPTVSEYELEQLSSGRWEREQGTSCHCPPCSFIGPRPTCDPTGVSTQGECRFLSNNKNTKSTDHFMKMEPAFSTS